MNIREVVSKMSRVELRDVKSIIDQMEENSQKSSIRNNSDYLNLLKEFKNICKAIDDFHHDFTICCNVTIAIRGNCQRLKEGLTYWQTQTYPTYDLVPHSVGCEHLNYNLEQTEQIRKLIEEGLPSIDPFCFNEEAKVQWGKIYGRIQKWKEKVEAFSLLNEVFAHDIFRMIGEES